MYGAVRRRKWRHRRRRTSLYDVWTLLQVISRSRNGNKTKL